MADAVAMVRQALEDQAAAVGLEATLSHSVSTRPPQRPRTSPSPATRLQPQVGAVPSRAVRAG